MQPSTPYQPNAPPAYGQPQPGPYPGQYPPPYPPPQYAPPPRKPMSGALVAVIVVAIVLAVVIPVAIVLMTAKPATTTPQEPRDDVETALGLRVVDSGGDWIVEVTSGSKAVSSVRLMVINPSTGAANVNKMLGTVEYQDNDPDASYNDNNGNNKMDAGDTILLKSSGGHVHSGDKVQFVTGDTVIGAIKELP